MLRLCMWILPGCLQKKAGVCWSSVATAVNIMLCYYCDKACHLKFGARSGTGAPAAVMRKSMEKGLARQLLPRPFQRVCIQPPTLGVALVQCLLHHGCTPSYCCIAAQQMADFYFA